MARDQLTPREAFSNSYVKEVPEELGVIEEAARRDTLEGIQLGRTEGALLSLLVKLVAPKVVVEIGGLYGASASWILSGLSPQGRLITVEKDPERARLLKAHLRRHVEAGKLEVVVGDAQRELASLPQDLQIEMVFIDANKSAYEDYLDWAEKRIAPGGLLIADNTFLFGTMLQDSPEGIQPSMWNAMRRFNDRLRDSKTWSTIILPTTEGFTLALRR